MSEFPQSLLPENELQAFQRFDPRLVNIVPPDALPPVQRILTQPPDESLLTRIGNRMREILSLVTEDLPPPEQPRPNLTVTGMPALYGLSDAWRYPVALERYQAVLPEYVRQYRTEIDENRFPFHIAPLPETGLPRYLTGYLADEMVGLDDPAVVQARSDEWLAQNGVLVAAEQARGMADGLRYVDQVRFRGSSSGGRGLESTIAQSRYQQYYNDLPIFGGAMSVTLTQASRHLSITNSFFPIPDEKRTDLQPLTGDAKEASRQRAVTEAKRLLAVDAEFTGLDAIALSLPLLASAAGGSRWGEWEELLAKKFLSEVQSFAADNEMTAANRIWLDASVGRPLQAWVLAFWAEHRRFGIPEWQDSEQIAVVSYQDRDMLILPYGEDYHLAWRLHITPPRSYQTWQVFVDAHSGVVLGEPESLAAHLGFVASSASLEAGQPDVNDPNLTAQVLDGQIAPLFQLKPHTQAVTSLSQIVASGAGTAREAVNIAVHALRCFDYFVHERGVDSARLLPDVDPETPNSSDPLTLVVGHQGINLEILFNPANANVVFQSDPGAGIVDGPRRIHQPSLDPEVIYHEVVHACMWRLNPTPFVLPQQNVPFARALLEGYAIYFARSIAAHNMPLVAADIPGNDEHLWARAAYRRQDLIGGVDFGWGQNWSLFRDAECPGEDLLPWPGLYPSKTVQGLEVYRIGMIWARALWDVRRILGPDITERIALATYPALVGWAISFETAADNFVDALRRNTTISPEDIAKVEGVFNSRRISPGREIRAVAETVAADGTVACYAGGPRFLHRSVNHGPWTALPWPPGMGEPVLGVTALAASGPELYAAVEGKVHHFDGANWTEIPGWPESQLPLSMHHTGHSLWVGSSSAAQEFVAGPQPHNGTWTERPIGPAGPVAILSASGFSVREGGVDHPGISLLALGNTEALAWFTSEQNLQWQSLNDRGGPQNQYIGWPLCLAGVADSVYLGTLNSGLWKKTIRVNGGHLTQPIPWQPVTNTGLPACVAILALASHNGALFVGTSAGLFRLDETANPAWQLMPISDGGVPGRQPMVRSLCVTDNHLLVGTARDGVWLRPRNGGAWQNVEIA